MSPAFLLIAYCLLILLASLVGGWAPMWMKLTHERMETLISMVAGFMLGIGVLHLLPHAIEEIGSVQPAMLWLLAGFLVMFFIERFFCFHHHDFPAEKNPEDHHQSPHPPNQHPSPPRDQPQDHSRPHPGGHSHHAHSGHELTWGGAAIGLTLHSVFAGMALGASIYNESGEGHGQLAGLGVFLIIFLHKPFDSLSLSTLMTTGGWSMRSRQWVNALFALAVPVGVVVYYFGNEALTGHGHSAVGYVLGFSAGVFLCISMSDLLPELQFHQHDRVKLSVMLMMGLILAWMVHWFESESHDHGHVTTPANPIQQPAAVDPHDHGNHHDH